MSNGKMTTRLALFWNTLQTFGMFGINFIALIVLARLLTPEDYGVYGVLMIFISISELIADCGMGGYMIKKQNTTDADYNTLFVYNMIMSTIMYSILFFTAPLISNFYSNPQLTTALRILGLVVLVQAFSITQATQLLKAMKFDSLALVSIIGGVCGLILAIILAKSGKGYWALIYQQLCYFIIVNIGYIVFTRNIPRLRFNLKAFKEQFSFGIHLFGASVVQAISSNLSNNIIGKIFNLSLTGLYFQASKLQNYPLSMLAGIVDRTFFPILSRLNHDMESFRSYVANLRVLAYAAMFPIFTFIICFSGEIIRILLGKEWLGSTIYFQLLMLASYPMLVKLLLRSAFKALGKTYNIFRTEIITAVSLFTILIIATVLKNMLLIVLAIIFSQIISAVCFMWYSRESCGLDIKCQLIDIIRYIPVACIPALSLVSGNEIIKAISFVVLLALVVGAYILLGNKEYPTIFSQISKFAHRSN